MAKTLKIVFDIGGVRTSTFSLADPKDDITKSAVQTAATTMLAKDFVLSGGSLATDVKDAYIENYERIELA